MLNEKIPFIAGEDSFTGEYIANSPNWERYDPPSIVRKGALALALQWHKANDIRELTAHMKMAGGTEMAAQSFANGIIDHVGPYMSRTDLKQMALAILLELERKNQETPNPPNCDDIASAIVRIQHQVSHEASYMQDLPSHRAKLRQIDPRVNPEISIVTGERFTVSLPTRVEDGYVWWFGEIDSPILSTVSTLKRDPMSDSSEDGNVECIETVFTFQGMHEGEANIDFKLCRSFAGMEILAQMKLAVKISPYKTN